MTGGLPNGPPTPPYTEVVVWFLSWSYAGTNWGYIVTNLGVCRY